MIIPTLTFKNLNNEKKNRIIQAAIDEFSERRFHEAKLSNIIKNAGIPRGSFYQYFEDKLDLYKFIFNQIGEHKMEYLTDDLKNPHELAFFDLFRELYKTGLKFAYENPKYIKITSLLLASRDVIYKEIFEQNINIAVAFYKSMIIRDQQEGRMDKGIDPDTLAELVINITMNVTFSAIPEGGIIDFKEYEKNIEKVIYIFEKGIKGA